MGDLRRSISAAIRDDEFVQIFIEELAGGYRPPAPDELENDEVEEISDSTVGVGLEELHETVGNSQPRNVVPALQAQPSKAEHKRPAEKPPVPSDGTGAWQVRIVPLGADPYVMPLSQTPITIGRMSQNSVVLQCDRVSREHAKIWIDRAGPRIDDLGSANGTWVNGTKVPAAYLRAGDTIQIGTASFYIENAGPDAGAQG